MDKEMIPYVCMFLSGVFIASLSQVMLKKSAENKHQTYIDEYLNPLVIGAYSLFGGTTLLSVIAYRKLPLSMGVILETTSYIYVTFLGVKLFGEKIDGWKVCGLFLIISGVLVFSV